MGSGHYDLIFQITATVGDETRAKVILDLLVENGSARIGRGGSPLLEDVQKLRRKGVLQQHFRVDVVTPYHRQALAILQRQAGAMPA